jgi:hypothetical protein
MMSQKIIDSVLKETGLKKAKSEYQLALDEARNLADKINESATSSSEKKKLQKRIDELKKKHNFKAYDFS